MAPGALALPPRPLVACRSPGDAPPARSAAHRPLTWPARAATLALLLLQLLQPRAWDRERMLSAAALKGPQAVAGAQALQQALGTAQGSGEAERLRLLNGFFNGRVAFAEDTDTTGDVDQWASPLELLARGAGDCEDYAIAKYFSLIAAGVPAAKLRMVYVRADVGGLVRAHMVLAYYPSAGAEPLILDNLDGEIRPASRRRDLSPVFSFNAEGLWQGTGAQAAGDPVARLSRWREVLAKARAEGFV